MLIVNRIVIDIDDAALFLNGLIILNVYISIYKRILYNDIITNTFDLTAVIGSLFNGTFIDRVT